MQKQIASEEDMLAFGSVLAKAIKTTCNHHNHSEDGMLIYLYGLLGAGKTTLVRGFLRALGFAGKVKSPTYTLVEPYEIGGKSIFHFDLYRINDADELIYLGIQDYFVKSSISFIEWPENGQSLLPAADVALHIEFNGEHKRTIRIETYTERGKQIVMQM